MATDKKSDKQVMDVSKPGKTPAAASARPVIVGHRTQVQDPMVTSAEESNPDEPVVEEETTPVVASPAASKKVIAPITEDVTPEQKPETAEPKAEETEEAAPTADEPETSESAEVDVLADQVGNNKKEEQLSEEERKKQEAIEKLVADKQYFVPIGKAHYNSRKSMAVIILLLLIIIAGGLAAVDAGLLDIGIDLPFDFIKNN